VGLGLACCCGNRHSGNRLWLVLAMERLGLGERLLRALCLRIRAVSLLLSSSVPAGGVDLR
jgi:hypothetical protein